MRYDLLETTADDFIADAVREIAKTDIGFTNGFRFGVPVPPETVTEADLWNLLPMDARMKRGWVTGKELKDYLENELEMVYAKTPLKLNGGWGPRASGMTFVFDARAEYGRQARVDQDQWSRGRGGRALHHCRVRTRRRADGCGLPASWNARRASSSDVHP